MFSLTMDFCADSSILKSLDLTRSIIYIIKILVPILLMIKMIKDIFKDMVSSTPEKVTGNASKIIKTIAIALIIFVAPTLIVNIMRIFVDYEDVENKFIDCQLCLDDSEECEVAMQIAEYQESLEYELIDNEQTITAKWSADPNATSTTNPSSEKPTDSEYSAADEGTGADAKVVGGGKYFDRNDVTKISGLTAEQLVQKLKNCKKYGGKAKRYVPYAEDLIAAEKKWGLNVFYMLGVYSLESGWAGSDLARKCNNLGGIKYSSKQTYFGKHTSRCWKQSTGAWFAGFDKVGGFVEYHAKLVKTKYVTPGAPYYHGKTPEAISKVYGHKRSVGTVIQIATNLSNA